MTKINRPWYILPAIVVAQFLGTSTWFAGNAILPALQLQWNLPDTAVASLTNSVQVGFITGALVFALLAIADRISPRILFAICALGTAFFNLGILFIASELEHILWLRFLGGIFLAGVYPVGMKIATGWYPEGLGRALGFLIGALALGTSSGHFFSAIVRDEWQAVIYLSSGCALIGGFIVWCFVPDGPALHKGAPLKIKDLTMAIKHKPLQSSAGGYFGHMWELYAVYALVPYWLIAWSEAQDYELNIAFWAFFVIAIGALGCVAGGFASLRFGSRRVAETMLCISGVCCALSPLAFEFSLLPMLLFWTIWGFTVVADSPQFSSLSAQTAPKQAVGTALTMINAVGFTITIIAVQITASLLESWPVEWVMVLLLPGPVLGLISLRRLKKTDPLL